MAPPVQVNMGDRGGGWCAPLVAAKELLPAWELVSLRGLEVAVKYPNMVRISVPGERRKLGHQNVKG